MALAHGTPDGTGSLVYSKLDDTRIRGTYPKKFMGFDLQDINECPKKQLLVDYDRWECDVMSSAKTLLSLFPHYLPL